MSKEVLIARLQEETAREMDTLAEETARRIQTLEETFATEREAALEKVRELGRQRAHREKERLRQALQTEIEHERQELLWQVLGEVFDAVKERLAGIREDEAGYSRLFECLFRESIVQLRRHAAADSPILVQVDARDVELMGRMEREEVAQVEAVLATWGGMMVRDNQRGMLIDNRLEARLERVRPVFTWHWLAEVATLVQDGV